MSDLVELVEKVCDIIITKNTLSLPVILLYTTQYMPIEQYPWKYLFCKYEIRPNLSQIITTQENIDIIMKIINNYTDDYSVKQSRMDNVNSILYVQYDSIENIKQLISKEYVYSNKREIYAEYSVSCYKTKVKEYFMENFMLNSETEEEIYQNIWKSINHILCYHTEIKTALLRLEKKNVIGYVKNLHDQHVKVYNSDDQEIETTGDELLNIYLGLRKPNLEHEQRGIVLPDIVI